MSSPEANTKAVHRYLETVEQGRPDDIVALYAEDATLEDPAGSDVHIGHEAIRGFYKAVEGASAKTEIITLRALGNEVAWLWKLSIHGMTIDIISVMTFDDDSKVTSMKAYWGPDNITQS